MKRKVALKWWLFLNLIVLPFYVDKHYDYYTNKYVLEGRGNSKVITKEENPQYYERRMLFIWSGYILIPLFSWYVVTRRKSDKDDKD
jgi:hypothetical protein